MTVRLRPATAQDAVGIARVHVETWRSTYAGLLPDAYLAELDDVGRAAAWARELSARPATGSVFVAEAAEAGIVGFASCGRARTLPPSWAGRPAERVGEAFTLYVDPDFQGRGLGRGLLAASFGALQARGCGAALLWVVARNPARFFYEAQGAVRIGARTERFAGTDVEETCYGWPDLASALRPPA